MNVKKDNIINIEDNCDDFLVICDHSSNNIPDTYNNLGFLEKILTVIGLMTLAHRM